MISSKKDLQEIFEKRSRMRELSETIEGLKALETEIKDPAAAEGIDFLAQELVALQAETKNCEHDLEEFIGKIPDSIAKLVMRLRFLHGMSWKEISAYVGKTEKGASEIFYKKIKKYLQW